MATPSRRRTSRLLVLLAPVALTLALGLIGYQALASVTAPRYSSPFVFSTTPISSAPATPTLPALTIGVWTSTTTPSAGESFTIFALCLAQDPARGGPTGPAAGLQVRIGLSGAMTQSLTETTGADGLAQADVRYTPARPDQPVTIAVEATWRGKTYQGQIFVMASGPSSSPTPPTPPAVTPTPNSTPNSTPNPTPTFAPNPTPTPHATPTSTAGP